LGDDVITDADALVYTFFYLYNENKQVCIPKSCSNLFLELTSTEQKA